MYTSDINDIGFVNGNMKQRRVRLMIHDDDDDDMQVMQPGDDDRYEATNLSDMVFTLIFATLWAWMEVEMEGKHGWAVNLPGLYLNGKSPGTLRAPDLFVFH